MAEVPETSTTLLRDLAGDSQHARWGEFVARYRPMMESYMQGRFPELEADDIIQETLIVLIRILPAYRYCPEEKGSFHNYLTGILRNKALKQLAKLGKAEERKTRYAAGQTERETNAERQHRQWQESVFEIALRQLMSDETIQGQTKEVFRRLAINGEEVEAVAKSLGIKRNAADQMKSRMKAKLQKLVADLERVDDARFES